MYLDKNGLIVTSSYDGGDSLSETGRYFFLLWFNLWMKDYSILQKLPKMEDRTILMNKMEVQPGIYVRNPAPNPANPAAIWEADPNTTSRDQLIPVIWYCAAYKDRKRLLRLFWACLKRGMFAQNIYKNWYTGTPQWKLPDQMWTCIPYFIRAMGWWSAILYPLLWVLDLFDFLGVLMALFPYQTPDKGIVFYNPTTWLEKKGPDSVDDNNMDISLFGSIAFKPTLVSCISCIIWGQFRPKNLGNQIGYTNNCLAAMFWYHAPQNGGNIEVVWLYTKPILKYLKKII